MTDLQNKYWTHIEKYGASAELWKEAAKELTDDELTALHLAAKVAGHP